MSIGRGLVVGLLVVVLVALGIGPAGPQSVAAADGDNISQQGMTTQQALGISPDGGKVCAVWTQFDVAAPQVFFRLYDARSGGWDPPLGQGPFQVSSAGNVNRPRCAIDAAGTTHVVWQQKHRNGDGSVSGQLDVAYRRLPAGVGAGDGGRWSGIPIIAENRSSVDIAPVENAPNGKIWLVARNFREGGSSEIDVRSWEPGREWSGQRLINTGGGADSPRIAPDNQGRVHILFRNGGSSGISYLMLDANGNVALQTPVPNGTQAGAASITVNRNSGEVHVAYAKDFTKLYYARKPIDGGFSLAQIDEGTKLVDDPSINWSANGWLTVTFNNNGGGEIAAKQSTDGGNSWGDRRTVASPDGGTAAPWSVADRDGNAYVAYNRRAVGDVHVVRFPEAAPPAPSPSPSPTPPPTAPAPPDVPGGPAPACFAETGKCVRGLFLTYWLAHGGLAVNGYPLTDEYAAYLEDGKAYTVQYFERVRLEYHPENTDPAFSVLLGQFGRAVHPADRPAAAREGYAYFEQTGHNVSPRFLDYWNRTGGLAQFGLPISEEFVETLENGQQYSVQYFERARFEYHPENTLPNDVLLGQLGRRVLEGR